MRHITLFLTILFMGCTVSVDTHNSTTEVELNKLIDNWHKAAAEADGDTFFGTMSDSSIYIGTDATERWTKEEFYSFAQPYFDRGSAWDFTPYDRLIQFSSDGKIAWFSELLDTWMGVCRGSGVLIKENGEWKISHYHLSITVPNEIIKDFIALIEKGETSNSEENGSKNE